MKDQIRVIKNDREYNEAIRCFSALMDEDLSLDTEKQAEFELLALVIKTYEAEVVAPVSVDPIEAILFKMDQLGLTKQSMTPYFGSLSRVSEVLSRKRSLSLAMIRMLHNKLGIPASLLISESKDIDQIKQGVHYDYSKFPIKEMLDRGYFKGFNSTLKEAKEMAEELITGLGFFNVKDVKDNFALLRAPLCQSDIKTMDEYSLIMWRILVLQNARTQRVKGKYDKGVISKEWLQDLAKLSRFQEGPKLAKQYLSDSGIKLVIVKHFKKTYLDGAAMLDGETPIVALTLRHDRIDNFWFALMHELIHVDKHLSNDAENKFIVDNFEDKIRSNQREQEADAGAKEALIPLEKWANSPVVTIPSTKNVMALASDLKIHPSIVAGRVRHETKNWKILRTFMGAKGDVTQHFECN